MSCAQQMFELLPSAFYFKAAETMDHGFASITTRTHLMFPEIEEHILHGMSGTMLAARLSSPLSEGHLTGDDPFGYGILATIHSGSSFIIIRNPVAPGVWKTTSVDTRIDQRVIFFETFSRHQESEHKISNRYRQIFRSPRQSTSLSSHINASR